MLKLQRASGTREYRLTIIEDQKTRTYTVLAQSRDEAWEQIADTIPCPEDPEATVTLRRIS